MRTVPARIGGFEKPKHVAVGGENQAGIFLQSHLVHFESLQKLEKLDVATVGFGSQFDDFRIGASANLRRFLSHFTFDRIQLFAC